MKKKAIFGGTFDPIHFGHISLADAAVKEIGLDELLFMPNNISPFKISEDVAAPESRCDMIELVLPRNKCFSLSRYELDRKGVSYTYDTLCAFRKRADTKFYFVLGFDSIMTLNTWYKGEQIISEFAIIAGRRPGTDTVEANEMIEMYRKEFDAEITVLDIDTPDVSAMEIREAITENKCTDRLIPLEVKEYINKNGLYRY